MGKLSSAKQTVVRGAAVMLVLQIVEQATGLLSQTLIAAYFGASAETDAYLVATTVISLVIVWISHPIARVLIPMFRHDLARKGEGIAWANIGVLFNNFAVLFVVLTVIGWFAAPALVRVVGLGFDDRTFALSVFLARISLFGLVFAGLSLFLAQLYYSYHHFSSPGIARILANLVLAAGLFLLGSRYGITAVAIAGIAATAANFAVQLPLLWRHRDAYRARIDFRHPAMREVAALSGPVVLTTGGAEIDRISDRLFASLLASGSLSALAFARLIERFADKLLYAPLQQASFPHFTKLIAEEDFGPLSRQLFQYVRLIAFVSVPAAIGMMVLAEPIVSAVFQRGAFDETAVRMTSAALVFYALGIPAAFVGRVFNNTFLSLKDTRTPMRTQLGRIALKIGLALCLIPWLAHAGIALAESVSHVVRAAVLFRLLPAEVKGRETWPTIGSFARTIAATTVMALAVWTLKGASDGELNVILQLVCLVPLGVVVYFLASWLGRQSELQWIGRSFAAITRR